MERYLFTKNCAMIYAFGYDKAPTHSTINLVKKKSNDISIKTLCSRGPL